MFSSDPVFSAASPHPRASSYYLCGLRLYKTHSRRHGVVFVAPHQNTIQKNVLFDRKPGTETRLNFHENITIESSGILSTSDETNTMGVPTVLDIFPLEGSLVSQKCRRALLVRAPLSTEQGEPSSRAHRFYSVVAEPEHSKRAKAAKRGEVDEQIMVEV